MMRSPLLVESSLAQTVAAVEDAVFFGRPPTRRDARRVMEWLADRHATAKGYRRTMCAPTEEDRREGARLFTGERLGPGAQMLHVLGEEAYRSYLLLAKWNEGADMAPAERMSEPIANFIDHEYEGRYCCGPCSVSVWRALSAGGYSRTEERLRLGMHFLHTKRDGKGRWGNLPFYYTLLTLTEIDLPEARIEVDYAAKTCEQLLQRHATIVEPFATRRSAILERTLSTL
jgi:hypothetical protein